MTLSNVRLPVTDGKSSHANRGDTVACAAAAVAAAAVVSTGAGGASAATGRLLVHLHVSMKQRAFQTLLEAGLPGVTATAVGRIADFERALEDAPDAVLTLPIVLGAKGLTPSLRGAMGGSTEERYALLGSGSPPDPAQVVSVGALDVLGRDGTNRFVRGLVNAGARVERVTKIEDLLPLLQMQRVDAVLLPARLIAELRAASRLPLAERELAIAVGLPAAANTGPNGPSVLAAIGRLPKDLSRLLGVDEWR
jgi:hypothetical protein